MIIGKAAFVKEALKKLKEGYEGKAEISHRRALRTAGSADEKVSVVAKGYQIPADEVKAGRHSEAKKTAMYLMKKHTGMTNGEIGKEFGELSYSAVAKAYKRPQEAMEKKRSFRAFIRRIEENMSNVNRLLKNSSLRVPVIRPALAQRRTSGGKNLLPTEP